MAIVIDSTSNSGVKAAVSNYSWNHTVAGGVGRYLVVTAQCRDNDNPTNRPITGITAGGVAMTLAKAMLSTDADGDDMGAEIWVLPNPAVGTISISITYTGTVDHSGASAISFFNVKQSTAVNASGENEETIFGVDPSVDITTTVNNCYIIDSCYTQDSNNYTAGTDQTIIAQLGTNGGGNRAVSSYKLKATAGATMMSWTNGGSADQNVQVAIAIEPSTIQYDTTSTASDSADPTTLTWSHTTTTESNRLLVVGVSAESDTGGHTAQTVSGITYGSINGTNLTSGFSDTDATSYNTASVTPTSNNLILLTVTNVKSSTPDIPTISGNGLTWVQIDTHVIDSIGTMRRQTMFRSMGASPSSGAVTISFSGATQTACSWAIDQFSGVDTSGTNGSGAVVQSAKTTQDNTGNTTSCTATLAAFSSVNNATYGAFGSSGITGLAAGSGFTLLASASSTTPTSSANTEWRPTNDTSVDFTFNASDGLGVIALEIKAKNSLQTLTQVRTDYITDNGTELWYLVAPATGENNIVVTMTAVVDGLYGAAMTFSGVDQSSPIDNNAGTTATNTVISQSLTTVAADAMIVNIMQHQNSASVHTPDTNQTQRFNATTTGDFSSAGGTRLVTTATSYTTSWTTDISDAMTLSIASLRPYALSSIKTIMGLAIASVKTVNGLAIASVKNWNGLA